MSAITQTALEQVPMAKAINDGLRQALAHDETVLVMGEDVGTLGGVFRITDGLAAEFGTERIIDTPLAESGIVGTAIGLAMRGYRPVCEIQFDGFIYPGFNQITTQLAKLHSRTHGRLEFPVVIRVPYGGNIGSIEHHSESPEVLFAHTAGLRVVSPSTPADAHRMIQQAIACPDPVLFFEPKSKYWSKGPVELGRLSEADLHDIAGLQTAAVRRAGTDVTIAGYGPVMQTCLGVADTLADDGVSAEVLDLRSISPLDFDTVSASVMRTGHLVVVHEAPVAYGAGAELAARITERCFYHLQAPVLRVGGFHMPYPPSQTESDFLPGPDRILDAVQTALRY